MNLAARLALIAFTFSPIGCSASPKLDPSTLTALSSFASIDSFRVAHNLLADTIASLEPDEELYIRLTSAELSLGVLSFHFDPDRRVDQIDWIFEDPVNWVAPPTTSTKGHDPDLARSLTTSPGWRWSKEGVRQRFTYMKRKQELVPFFMAPYKFDLDWFTKYSNTAFDSLRYLPFALHRVEQGLPMVVRRDTCFGAAGRTLHIAQKGSPVQTMQSWECPRTNWVIAFIDRVIRDMHLELGEPSSHKQKVYYWERGEQVYFCSDTTDGLFTVGIFRKDAQD